MPTPEQRYQEVARRLRRPQAAGDRVFGPTVLAEAIAAAENNLGLRLPEAYRRLLMEFGPISSTRETDTPDTSRRGRRLDRRIPIHGRISMLAPGTDGEDDLVRVTELLRMNDPPLPPSLIPYLVTEVRAEQEHTFTYDCFDYDRMRNGEPTSTKWFPWFQGKTVNMDKVILDVLESEVSGLMGPPGRHASYDELVARLRSNDARDHFVYAEPSDPHDITRVEQALGITLPEPFRRFLMEFGPADIPYTVLDPSPEAEKGIFRITEEQRRADPALPEGLIPFALNTSWAGSSRAETKFICFDYTFGYRDQPTVTEWAPSSPPEDRQTELDLVFLDWLEQRFQFLDQMPLPPRDWRNNGGWERYWKRTLGEDTWKGLETHRPAFGLRIELAMLRRRGDRRILFAGNGISLEPHAFVRLGFDVTALDVSPTASEYVKTSATARPHLEHSRDFGLDILRPRGSFRHLFRRKPAQPGRLTVVNADMFEYDPGELFDVVYSCRSFQAFSEDDRRALARRFFDWLRPGGLCIVDTMNLCMGGHDKEIEADFDRAGFVPGGRDKHPARGEKAVAFCHGSG